MLQFCRGLGPPTVMHLPYLLVVVVLVVVILCNVLVLRPVWTSLTLHRKNGSLWRSILAGIFPISLR
jgi:hypothetical protein